MQITGPQRGRPVDAVCWLIECLQANVTLVVSLLKSGYFIVRNQQSITLKMRQSGPPEPPSPQVAVGSLSFWTCTLFVNSVSSHEPPLTPGPEDPAAHSALTLSTNTVDSVFPTDLPRAAFPPPSWCWRHPGGKTLGLILDSLLSLNLDFQLVSTPVQLFPPNKSRI